MTRLGLEFRTEQFVPKTWGGVVRNWSRAGALLFRGRCGIRLLYTGCPMYVLKRGIPDVDVPLTYHQLRNSEKS